MNHWIYTATLALATASAPLFAQGKLDADTMKAFGGTYQLDCGNNASPKATVFPDALVFLHGDKRVAGSRPEAQASFYGNSPPPEYLIMLVSDAPGGEQLFFAIHQDKAGYYLKLDGDQKVMAAIGKPLANLKFRRCDGSAPPPMPTAAAQAAPKSAAATGASNANTAKVFKGYALTELTASGLLYNKKAKAAYYKALGPLVKEPWLAALDGPSNEFRPVKVAGADYMLGSTCQNHDCYDHTVVLLWSGVQNVVYGKVVQKGKSTLIGSPPRAVAAELERLWKGEFRKQQK